MGNRCSFACKLFAYKYPPVVRYTLCLSLDEFVLRFTSLTAGVIFYK